MGNELATQIRESLSLREVMESHGVSFNRRGFAICPFHREKTASLSIKNERYKCFGCGAHGDAIDFVMRTEGLSFRQALARLDSEFHLNLIGKAPDMRARRQMAENRRVERACRDHREKLRQNYLTLCQVHAILFGRLCDGEGWLAEPVARLGLLLDDFTGEEARMWRTAMKWPNTPKKTF